MPLTPERRQQVETLYQKAAAQPPDQRSAWLAEACADDDALLREVESLLSRHGSGAAPPGGKVHAPTAALIGDRSFTMAPGRQLGVYEIVAPIGAGGMGEVYRARDTRLGRDVAIKILPEAFSADRDRLARFEREARVLAALNHPNIATIHGIEESGGVKALVLELVPGDTLADQIARTKRGGLPVAQALAIARQIAGALEAAHEKGIVHRDLKPANIKITPDGLVKVLDFGLAKPRTSESGTEVSQALTATVDASQGGLIIGTAAYMSPEQARGLPVDKRTDVWAFGCVLYEMLAGRPVFARDTVTDTLAALVSTDPDFGALPKSVASGLVRVLRRCLDKDPNRRFRDIADAAIAIEDAQEQSTPDSSSPTAPAHRRISAFQATVGTALGLLVLTALVGVLLRSRDEDKDVTRVSISAPGPITPQSAPAVSPDGRRIAFAAKDASGRTMLWLRELDALQPRALPQTDDAAHPYWSPDGKAIGFLAGGRVKRLDLADGTVRVLAPQTTRFGDTWGDGVILFAPQGLDLATMPASGGTPRPLGVSGIWPWFLPDGRHFLFVSRARENNPGGIYAGSIDSGDATFVLESDFRGIYASGFLLTVRDQTLVAFPFDVDRLAVTGEPFVVADGLFSARGASQASFSVSQTGVLAYVNASVLNTQVSAFDRNGRPLGPTTSPPDQSGNQSLLLSPSGQQLAMGRGRQGVDDSVWLFDLATGGASRLVVSEPQSNTPVWSHDGRRLLFLTIGGRPPTARLGVKNLNGQGAEETLHQFPPSQRVALWDWSPDGRFVVYGMSSADNKDVGDLWLLPLDGEPRPRPYLQSGFHKTQAQVSPSGRWLAYTSFESGKDEVYVQSFPEPGNKRQVSVDGGMQPRWRADGAELFYLDQRGRLVAVPVESGHVFTARPPSTLFQTKILPQGSQSLWFYTAYAVSGDGQRFFINAAPDDPGPPITVMFNWPAVPR